MNNLLDVIFNKYKLKFSDFSFGFCLNQNLKFIVRITA